MIQGSETPGEAAYKPTPFRGGYLTTKLTVFKNGKDCVQHPTLVVSGVTKDTLTGRLLYAYTPRWPTPHHLVARTVTIRLKGR